MILILDFGSPTTQRIARRIRELNLYTEVRPYNNFAITEDVKAVILSGSSFSIFENKTPGVDLESLLSQCPVLAIGYGAQYMISYFGGKIGKNDTVNQAVDLTNIIDPADMVMDEIFDHSQVWMPKEGRIQSLPGFFTSIADLAGGETGVFRSVEGHFPYPVYGFQFHPEVPETHQGIQFLENFLVHIANIKQDWTPARFVEDSIQSIRKEVGNEKVVLGLSGGVDSSVSAGLLHRAIGQNLI